VLLEGRVPNWTARLKRRFQRTLGADARRVRLLPAQPNAEFLRLLELADVMLDPFPYGGGNTSYEGLAVARRLSPGPARWPAGGSPWRSIARWVGPTVWSNRARSTWSSRCVWAPIEPIASRFATRSRPRVPCCLRISRRSGRWSRSCGRRSRAIRRVGTEKRCAIPLVREEYEWGK